MGNMVSRGETSVWDRLVSQRGGVRYQGPLVVLVSNESVSAAEIFAQLVEDYDRGSVVGTRTAGAVLTSVFWPLAGGGKLQLSVYDYHSPHGRRIEGNGVEPNVVVEAPPAEAKEDPGIQAALKELRSARGLASVRLDVAGSQPATPRN
jgi:carboxyl-terminal processing protease